ncbi:MAG: GNAT family N-acetyltransferase [Candidatus Helarchaeota archaeon]
MAGNIIVRESTIEDLDELERLMKELTKTFRQKFFRDQWRLDMEYKYDVGGIFVAEDNEKDKIVGMILVDVGRDLRTSKIVGKIINFIVDPEYRGNGIGSKLLEMALEFSAERKAASVKINARRELKNTVEMFKKFGFEEVYMVMERDFF